MKSCYFVANILRCSIRKKSSERGFFVKILILSCNTGEGHNAAGHAVEEAALARGHEVNFVDAMQLGKRHTSRLISGLYIGIVKHLPWFFGFIYKLGMLISNRHFKSPVYWANAKLAKPLASLIEEGNYDIVVMPHLYPAETITYMKKHNMLPVKAVAIGTDYTCIPFWEETNCDYYVIPHEDLVDEYIKRGVPKEKLLPYGIPVRHAFAKHTPKDIARRKCHLDADSPTFLIMSGSMGFGKLAVFAMALYKQCKNDEHIVIICGNNKKLQSVLTKEFRHCPRVHVLGYTRHVSLYMDACDVIFTKPGGLTSTETLVKGIPTIHTALIPGCETANSAFFVDRGISYASKYMIEQIRLGKLLMRSHDLQEEMHTAQLREQKSDAAERIVDLLESLSEK